MVHQMTWRRWTSVCVAALAIAAAWSANVGADDARRSRYTPRHDLGPNAVRVMPLGDSITQGEAGQATYRYFLDHMLRVQGYRVDFVGSQSALYDFEKGTNDGAAKYRDFDEDHEGRWGVTSAEVAAKIEDWAKASKPDIVLLHVGTNDLFPAGQVSTNTRRIIHGLRKVNPRVVVILAQLLPVRGGEAAVSAANRRLLVMAAQEQKESSPVVVVNMNRGFSLREHFYDGVHLNEAGEHLMAGRWFRAIRMVRDNTHRIDAYTLDGALAPLERLRRAGDYGGIAAEVEEWIAGGRLRGDDVDKAARLLGDIASYKDAQLDRVAYLEEQGRHYMAHGILMKLRSQFRATTVAKEATAKLTRWQKDLRIAREARPGKAMTRAMEMVVSGQDEAARRLLETVVRTSAGTKAAADAGVELERIGAREAARREAASRDPAEWDEGSDRNSTP